MGSAPRERGQGPAPPGRRRGAHKVPAGAGRVLGRARGRPGGQLRPSAPRDAAGPWRERAELRAGSCAAAPGQPRASLLGAAEGASPPRCRLPAALRLPLPSSSSSCLAAFFPHPNFVSPEKPSGPRAPPAKRPQQLRPGPLGPRAGAAAARLTCGEFFQPCAAAGARAPRRSAHCLIPIWHGPPERMRPPPARLPPPSRPSALPSPHGFSGAPAPSCRGRAEPAAAAAARPGPRGPAPTPPPPRCPGLLPPDTCSRRAGGSAGSAAGNGTRRRRDSVGAERPPTPCPGAAGRDTARRASGRSVPAAGCAVPTPSPPPRRGFSPLPLGENRPRRSGRGDRRRPPPPQPPRGRAAGGAAPAPQLAGSGRAAPAVSFPPPRAETGAPRTRRRCPRRSEAKEKGSGLCNTALLPVRRGRRGGKGEPPAPIRTAGPHRGGGRQRARRLAGDSGSRARKAFALPGSASARRRRRPETAAGALRPRSGPLAAGRDALPGRGLSAGSPSLRAPGLIRAYVPSRRAGHQLLPTRNECSRRRAGGSSELYGLFLEQRSANK